MGSTYVAKTSGLAVITAVMPAKSYLFATPHPALMVHLLIRPEVARKIYETACNYAWERDSFYRYLLERGLCSFVEAPVTEEEVAVAYSNEDDECEKPRK